MKIVGYLVGFLASNALASDSRQQPRGALDCTSNAADTAALKRHVKDSLYFCKYYLAT